MLYNPAWSTIFKRQAPRVTLVDLKTSTGNSTSYSFTNVQPKSSGTGSFSTESLTPGSADGSYPRINSKAIYAIIVHAIDALTVFGITSVVWGGVSLTEIVDVGPAVNLTCTAIYWTTGAALEARTTDTVVVTPSESITGCAIAVVEITNFGAAQTVGTGGSTGTGGMPIELSSSDIPGAYYFVLGGLTCLGATLETLNWNHDGGSGPLAGLEILYETNTTEFTLTGYFAFSRQYLGITPTTPGYVNVDFSGAGEGNHAMAVFQA